MHYDESMHSLVLTLNNDFEGGGTYFIDHDAVLNPKQAGSLVSFRGDRLKHGGEVVTKGIRYIMAVAELALVPNSTYGIQGKYPVLPVWSSRPERDFFRPVYFQMPDGTLDPRFAYFPAYFKGLHVRLLLYGGKSVIPAAENIWAIQTEMIQHPTAGEVESVVSAQSFSSYDLAAAFMARQDDASWSLASFSPFDSCIPLEGFQGLTEVFRSSTEALALPSLPGPVPALRVFEITQ